MVGIVDVVDEVMLIWVSNGKVLIVVDGNSNLIMYEYDGFDWVIKICYFFLIVSGMSLIIDYE